MSSSGGHADGRGGEAHEGVTGLVVVDKEAGWTSHDVVARLRRVFGTRRVGHAGTLDPDATGVLLLGAGKTTRLLRFLTPLEKTYSAEVVLGIATTTLDASGDTVGTWDMSSVTYEQVQDAARLFTGQIQQVPPMVSAVKVGGRRLHTLARQGIEVDRKARQVMVHRFDVEPGDEPGVMRIEVTCSAGTYIRVLAADLGAALGGGAHLQNLCRTAIGPFTLAEARPVASIDTRSVLAPRDALRHLEAVEVSAEIGEMVARGLPLDRVPLGVVSNGPWALLDHQQHLLAVYEGTESDRIRPSVVLASR